MTRRLTALACAVLLGVAACSSGDDDDAQSTTSTRDTATTVDGDSRPEPGSRTGARSVGFRAGGGAGGGSGGEPSETFEPAENVAPIEPTESEIPMFEG